MNNPSYTQQRTPLFNGVVLCASRFAKLAIKLAVVSLILVTTSQLSFAGSKLADQRNVIFDRYTTADGLSHTTITAIAQDTHGFMWIGTQEGLNRFDGYTFENFYHRDDIAGSISHHSITALLCDSDGVLWIGTEAGLNRLNDNTKRFESITLTDPILQIKEKIQTLAEDSEGTLWVGTNRSLFKRTHGQTFVEVLNPINSKSLGSVTNVLEDSNNMLWVGTSRSGVFTLDKGEHELSEFNIHDSTGILNIMEGPENNIWLAPTSGGILVIRRHLDNKVDRLRLDAPNSNRPMSRVRQLLTDENGDVWLGTSDGLKLFDKESGLFLDFLHDATDLKSISNNNVIELFHDQGGVIWVGTFDGLSKFNSKIVSFPNFRQGKDPGLQSNATISFAEGANNNVWIGTMNGLHKWDSERASFSRFSRRNSGLSDNRIMALAVHEGRVWAGTMTGGINILENDELVAIMQNDEQDDQSLSSNAISNIHVDINNQLWVATYGGGVNRYLGQGKFERYPNESTTASDFSDLRTVDIESDETGQIWIATNGGGLIVLNPTTGEAKNFVNDKNDPDSLSSNNVVSLLKHKGEMWIGTRDSGINRYDSATGKFQTFNRILGLASDLAFGILADDNDNIWISGGKGISVLNPSTGNVDVYQSVHGLQSDDFNSGAYLKLSDGTFLFGGNNGFNAFYPDRIKGNEYVPPIRLTQFSLFNEPASLKTPIYRQRQLELAHDESVFGFEFAAMDFTAPHKNRFRYRLEGFNNAWVEANENRRVTYTNLDPGTYKFSLQGANNDGVWNEKGTSILLTVSPPLWATWWAFAVYLAFALIFIRQALAANQARLRRDAEKRYNERLQLYIESLEEATDAVLIADANKNLMYANDAIKSILGISPTHVEGRSIMSLLFTDPVDANRARAAIQKSGRWHGEVVTQRRAEIVTTEITIAAVNDDDQTPSAFVSIVRDVTDRKLVEAELETHRKDLQFLVDQRTTALKHEIAENKAVQRELANSLEEKELLLKEVHHRVKNNMQVISSLLNIQAETVDNDIFSGLLGESQQRIKSMSLIHENLYQSDNLLEIDFEDYITMLANSLHRFYTLQQIVVNLDIQVHNVLLDIETAVPCGLIINELISNSFKHAFEGRTGKGLISILFKQTNTDYVLRITDDGNGLPDDFSLETQSSMGTEIIVILTQQIDGKITYKSENGAQFEIVFPKKETSAKHQVSAGY